MAFLLYTSIIELNRRLGEGGQLVRDILWSAFDKDEISVGGDP